ncbi:hypothetical protein ACFVQ4_13060 [Streptomyces laurentii]|uniref:hypothetical protein n=1 Tax=Streptomyces laurentii TaxID=39478 RepID=UPI00369F3BE5
MELRKGLAVAAASVATIVGVAGGTASATPTSAPAVQQQIDAYVSTHSEARQIDADIVSIPGGTLTMPLPGFAPTGAAISCAEGHLCIQDSTGRRWDFSSCGLYSIDPVGTGVLFNNQTSGTVTKFYNSDGSPRWTSIAKEMGSVFLSVIYAVRPC